MSICISTFHRLFFYSRTHWYGCELVAVVGTRGLRDSLNLIYLYLYLLLLLPKIKSMK